MAQGKRIKLTNSARDDLESIYRYGFIHHGEMAADAYIEHLFSALEMLQHHQVGQHRSDVGENFYSLAAGKHLLFFQTDEAEVLLVRVLHHSQDMSNPRYWL